MAKTGSARKLPRRVDTSKGDSSCCSISQAGAAPGGQNKVRFGAAASESNRRPGLARDQKPTSGSDYSLEVRFCGQLFPGHLQFLIELRGSWQDNSRRPMSG